MSWMKNHSGELNRESFRWDEWRFVRASWMKSLSSGELNERLGRQLNRESFEMNEDSFKRAEWRVFRVASWTNVWAGNWTESHLNWQLNESVGRAVKRRSVWASFWTRAFGWLVEWSFSGWNGWVVMVTQVDELGAHANVNGRGRVGQARRHELEARRVEWWFIQQVGMPQRWAHVVE